MIQFDFDYYRPKTINEAVKMMLQTQEKGLKAVYYSGGTELITNFRKGKAKADVVIDLKGIKTLTTLEKMEDTFVLGAALSLNEIVETLPIEPLQLVLSKIADHTTRNTLTIGGNICGRLPYKEAVLPLLAMDATAVIASENGLIEKPLRDVFDRRLKLEPSEFLAQIKLSYHEETYFSHRETEGTEIDYPILHLFALQEENGIAVALSGYGSLPEFKVFETGTRQFTEEMLDTLRKNIIDTMGKNAKACQRASIKYRQHLLTCAIDDMVLALKGGDVNEA